MEVKFESAVAATIGGAKSPNGGPPTREQIEDVIRFLRSAESGPSNGTSFMDFVQREIERHPPKLRDGQDYVAYSGVDAAGMNNGRNAQQYLDARSGKSGLIGDTPWGKFIGSQGADEQIGGMVEKFQEIMEREGLKPYNGDYAGALRDIMWNAGSSPYLENAVKSGRPIIAFVENAPKNRGFSNFELPVALEHPDVVMNGYPMRVFGAGDDALAFASYSAAEYQAFERSIADSATRNSGREVSVADVRSQLDVSGGYNAIDKTVFGMPRASFEQLPFDDMRSAGGRWSQAIADQSAIGNHRSEVGVAKAPVVESHRTTGPPQTVVTEAPPSAVVRMWHAAEDKATKIATGKTPIRMGMDGLPNDDVPHYPASQEHLRSYEQASAQMREFKVPPLWDRTDSHSYMLFGLLDGTGNDVFQDPLHATNVAKLREEVRALKNAGVKNVDFEYVPGPGTQENFFENTIDGATGRTSLARAEEMYEKLARQAQRIHEADPHAKISFHLEGFSRGASTVPLLARMVHERGIPDTRSAVESIDEHGNTVRIYTRYLHPPGQTPMSVGLYDPVPTGYLADYFDRRLPPSVVSGFQINAADERRGLFPVDRIIPEGLSQDGRFLSVTVAGAHSGIGGSYLRGGLGDRSLNLMTDYRNALIGEPVFHRVYETTDPRMNVIHHSTEGNVLFRHWPKIGRDTPEGEIRQLVPDYTHITPQGGVVHRPAQTPEPAGEMTQRLRVNSTPVVETSLVRSAEHSGGEAMLARVSRDSDIVLRPYDPSFKTLFQYRDFKLTDVPDPPALNPTLRLAEQPVALQAAEAPAHHRFSARVTPVVGGVAVNALLAGIEWNNTYQRAQVFEDTLGNDTAARDAYLRQGAQTAGGVMGGVAGTGAAVGLGIGTGGTFVLVAAGTYAVSVAAEKAVEAWQDSQIYDQKDRAGVQWEFKGGRWVRDQLADLVDDHHNVVHEQKFSALPEKAQELSYFASVEAVKQVLGKVPDPRNPFVQPTIASDGADPRSSRWEYQADRGVWEREEVMALDINNMPSEWNRVSPSSERAAQLNAQAMETIDDNLRAGPAVVAAKYQLGHKGYGYDHVGKEPAAVTTALSPDLLEASDGRHYRRDAQGAWAHEGQSASPNRALELELTRERLLPALEDHQQKLASMPAWQPPTPEEKDRALLRRVYVDNHFNPDIKAERFEAAYAAVQRTRAEHGIALGTTAFALDRDVNGNFSFDSPIQHTQTGADGVVRGIATTRPESIGLQADAVPPQPREERLPTQTAPEQKIAQASPEQRDARDQAMREANRQGLSQDDTQKAATLATIEVRAKRAGPSSSRDTQAESIEEPDATQQVAEAAPSQPVPPAPMPERDSQERAPQAEQERIQSHSVVPSSQDDTTQKVSASSLEERPQDVPDERAVVNTSPLAEQTSESVDMRQHAPKPRSERDAEVVQTVDRPPPTPLTQEGIADASVTKLVTDKSPPVQDIKAQPVNDPSVSRSAHIEQDDGAELATVPAHTVAGRGARSPGGATEDRENDRDDIDRRERPHAELQVAPRDVPLLPVIASEQDEEEERKDRGWRTPESSDASLSRTSEQTMPEADARPFDPRHPEHHEHAIYLNAKEKVADLYERHGIPMQEDQLERTTAALLSDARANKMTRIEEVQFTVSRQKPNGEMTVAGNLIAWEGDPKQQSQMPWMKFSATDMHAIDQRDPDRDYARFRTETIKEQQSLEEFQKQQEAINQNPTGPVMTMGARSLAMADAPSDGDGGGGDGGGGG